MASVLRDPSLRYMVPSRRRRRGPFLLAVHEPRPLGSPYRDSSIARTGESTPIIPPRRSSRPVAPRVKLHLKPGQKGTRQLLAEYGDRLICVRYRYDAQRKKRFKTIEIIVSERDWPPPSPSVPADQIVALRVAFADITTRQRVKGAGGTWNPERRVWHLRYDRAVSLGLHSHIVDDRASSTGYPITE